MTEREERKFEELVTVDDYMNEMQKLGEVAQDSEDEVNYFDKSIALLSKGLYKKYKYIVKISSKYCRKQSWLSILKDMWAERQQRKQDKRVANEEKNKDTATGGQDVSSQAETAPQTIEVLDKSEVKQLTEGEENEENSHEEEDVFGEERTQKDKGSE